MGTTQFLVAESPLRMMKNNFSFMLKALFVLKILKGLYWPACIVGKRLDQKAKVNFKICDVINWQKNDYNTYIAQWNTGNQTMKFSEPIEYNMTNIFLQKAYRKRGEKTSSRPFFVFIKLYLNSKQMVCPLVLIYFSRPGLGHTLKKTV